MNMINWERFYTDAKGYSEEDMMVDQIEIDIKNNRFVVISAADFEFITYNPWDLSYEDSSCCMLLPVFCFHQSAS